MADIERSAEAVWTGPLKAGKGTINASSDVLQNSSYTFASRFEQGKGTNPEELVAAAHAACFSMFLASTLEKQGHAPEHVRTQATVTLGAGPAITNIRLQTRASVDGIEEAAFQEAVRISKEGCPISKALSAVNIEVDASLE